MSDKVENKNFSPTPSPLPATLLSMFFWRSFLIQAGWNYERSQNIGFAFSLLPALRRLYPAPEAFRAAVLRHLESFNTQPYMAGFVIGNMARMEETLAGPGAPAGLEKSVRDIKHALSSSLASIGDRIFWGRLKPITTQICIVVWMLCGFYGWLFPVRAAAVPAAVLFAGPLLGMAVYWAFALYLRWSGLKNGYACGGVANCGLDMMDWRKVIRGLSLAGFALSLAIALGALGLLARFNSGIPAKDLAFKAGLVLSVLALHRLTRRLGRSVFFAIGVILAVSVLFFGVLKLGPFGVI